MMTREQAIEQAVAETRQDGMTRRILEDRGGHVYILQHATYGQDITVATVELVSRLGQVVRVTKH